MPTSQLHVSQHPLVKHKLSVLRDVSTDHRKFRELLRELALLVCYEVTQDLVLNTTTVTTPMGQATGYEIQEMIGVVPILRAGLGLLDGVLQLLPSVQVWHLGLYRDEKTLCPVTYYNRLPDKATVQMCIILDAMLATGGSAIAAADILKKWGVPHIRFLGVIAAPEGVEAFSSHHPDIPIHVAALDERLNDIGFIVPGLGDAGDRQFGT